MVSGTIQTLSPVVETERDHSPTLTGKVATITAPAGVISHVTTNVGVKATITALSAPAPSPTVLEGQISRMNVVIYPVIRLVDRAGYFWVTRGGRVYLPRNRGQ